MPLITRGLVRFGDVLAGCDKIRKRAYDRNRTGMNTVEACRFAFKLHTQEAGGDGQTRTDLHHVQQGATAYPAPPRVLVSAYVIARHGVDFAGGGARDFGPKGFAGIAHEEAGTRRVYLFGSRADRNRTDNSASLEDRIARHQVNGQVAAEYNGVCGDAGDCPARKRLRR